MSTELLDFIEHLHAWHSRKVANLRDVQEGAKEGTLLKLGEDSEGIPMTKREAQFFKLGIEASLIELGELPFTVTPNADANAIDDDTD